MFIITADQIDSSHLSDKAASALGELTERYASELVLPVDRNAGDEIQALVASGAAALAIITDLTRTGDWSVGCGIGAVRTPLPGTTREATGPGFVAARAAVERAKKAPLRFALSGAAPQEVAGVEALIDLLLLTRSRRSPEGWELFDLIARGMTQAEAASALGITPQAASQRARAAGIRPEIAAVPALAAALSRLDGAGEQNGIT